MYVGFIQPLRGVERLQLLILPPSCSTAVYPDQPRTRTTNRTSESPFWPIMRPLTLLSLLPLLPSSTARPVCSEAGSPCLNGSRPLAPLQERCRCGRHAFCFFGVCMCHPGYDPSSQCTRKLGRLNPWMSKGCLALHSNVTFAIDMPLPSIGGEYHRDGSLCPKFMRQCAYLCFSHLSYGVAVVPRSLWQQAQYVEAQVWAESGRSVMVDASSNDRAEEHWAAFSYLSCLPPGTSLGSVVGERICEVAFVTVFSCRGRSRALDSAQAHAALSDGPAGGRLHSRRAIGSKLHGRGVELQL